jgi:iron(III) transport system permease protein
MLNRQEAQQNTHSHLSFMDKIRRQYDLTPSITTILGLTTLFFVVFLIYPLLYVFKEAFWIESRFNLTYFKLMVTDPNIRELVINSFKIGVLVTVVTSFLSLPLAYFLTRYRYPGRDTLRAVILIPMIMPPFVGAIGMKQFFGLYGSVNMLLNKLNLIDITEGTIDWFGSGFWGVVMLSTLHLYPIMYLNIVAALANVDPSLEEAAENMGASRFQVFRQITLPLMMPGYFAGAILVFIWAFTDLGTPLIFNYNKVIAVRIFRQVTEANANPMGYALVVLIIVLTALAFYVSKRWTGSKHYEMLGRGHVTSREVDANWIMRSIIYLFIGGVTLVALLPHISVIMISLTPDASQWRLSVLPQSWTFSHYVETFTHSDTLPSILNSLKYSIFSTLLALVIGIVVSYLLTRKRLPFQNLLDAVAMLPLALPGVAIAFGYLGSFSDTTLLLRYLPDGLISVIDPRQNPTFLLIISYAVRRLPYMLRSIYAGLQQTSVTYEEASQNMGATPIRTLYKITLPLVIANILAGAILVFSFSMLEVSDSLILAMKDQHYPITKAIWALSQRPDQGAYTASALGVVGMLILIACLLGAGRVLGGKLGEIFRI